MATEKEGSLRSARRAGVTVETASDGSVIDAPSSIKEASGKERAERAFGAMSAPLQTKCTAIRELLAESGRSDAKAQFKLGALVNDAKGDLEKYGRRGVAQLATALGYNVATLYRVATVNERWSWSELSVILNKRGPTGLPLGFTHLVAIATVGTKPKRDSLIETALAEGLSVRELRRRAESVPKFEEEQSGAKVAHPSATVRHLIARSEAALDEVKRWEAALELLEERIPTPKLAAVAETALARQKELVERLSGVIARLDSWRTGASQQPAASVETGTPESLLNGSGRRESQRAVA